MELKEGQAMLDQTVRGVRQVLLEDKAQEEILALMVNVDSQGNLVKKEM